MRTRSAPSDGAPSTRRLAAPEDPALLRLKLLRREDAAVAEVGQALELAGGRGRAARRAALVHPLLVGLALRVDLALDLLRVADVREPRPPALARRLDHQAP